MAPLRQSPGQTSSSHVCSPETLLSGPAQNGAPFAMSIRSHAAVVLPCAPALPSDTRTCTASDGGGHKGLGARGSVRDGTQRSPLEEDHEGSPSEELHSSRKGSLEGLALWVSGAEVWRGPQGKGPEADAELYQGTVRGRHVQRTRREPGDC